MTFSNSVYVKGNAAFFTVKRYEAQEELEWAEIYNIFSIRCNSNVPEVKTNVRDPPN